MTIPLRSKKYSCAKGVVADTDVGVNSPRTENNNSVNISLSLTKDSCKNIEVNTKDMKIEEVRPKKVLMTNEHRKLEPNDQLLDKAISDPVEKDTIVERDIESAKQNVEEMYGIVKNKDNLIEALSLILDMYENNPLIVNKLIIPNEQELSRLLFLLTQADEIELVKTDNEVGCLCKPGKFTIINKIMVKKEGELYNFKYSFPNAVQLLDNRHISYKLVC